MGWDTPDAKIVVDRPKQKIVVVGIVDPPTERIVVAERKRKIVVVDSMG